MKESYVEGLAALLSACNQISKILCRGILGIGVLIFVMNVESGGRKEYRLQRRTILLVMWLVIFGLAAIFVFKLYVKDDGLTLDKDNDNTVDNGPMVGPLPAPVKSLMVKGAEYNSAGLDNLENPHQAIEDPDGRALDSFNSSLRALFLGELNEPVRIIHYGDSILTTDQLSGQIRQVLQKKFGDGGHGFVLMGKPWRWYRHLNVVHGAKGKWRARPLTSDPLKDGLYGLGGVAFEAQPASYGRTWAGTAEEGDLGRAVEIFDLSYLEQPRGGSFNLSFSDRPIEKITTASKIKRVIHKEIRVPRGADRIEIKYNNDGPLRLFGVTLESGEPGIVYDSLAINGARAVALKRFNKKHWISELKRRNPSLVILMLGANEGANSFLVLKEYKVHLSAIIQIVKEGLPDASLLIVGPLDQAKRNPDKTFGSKRMPQKLSKAQREVAFENGCAYFDTWTAMGGEGAMGAWFRRGLGGGDLIHPTEHGAKKIGNWIVEALLYEYQRLRTLDELE